MPKRANRSKKRRTRNVIIASLIISAFSSIAFFSFKYFEGVLSKHDDEVAYYNEGMDLYIDVINNYQSYISNIMGVAFAVSDSVQDKPDAKTEVEESIVKLSALLYSYNVERASNKLDSMLMESYVDEEKLSVPIKMYHDKKHDLDLAIVRYNSYASESELRTINNYDSIRLLVNDRATKDTILKSEGK